MSNEIGPPAGEPEQSEPGIHHKVRRTGRVFGFLYEAGMRITALPRSEPKEARLLAEAPRAERSEAAEPSISAGIASWESEGGR